MIPTPILGGTLYTNPLELRRLVTPEDLRVPGYFYVSEAINFLRTLGVCKGLSLEDLRAYLLEDMRVHPLFNIDPSRFQERQVSLYAKQGNVYTQGAAFAVAVGDLKKQQEESPYGVLVREHSACGYSEIGKLHTSLLYNNNPKRGPDGPIWFYDNAEKFILSFVKYGDGIVSGYPTHDGIERSLDCDCRIQRELAQFLIAGAGGVYISLSGNPQEGRGLGVLNKEKIYRLQEKGFTSAAACDELGLPRDIRDYEHSFELLKDLGVWKVGLLTNNLRKVAAFEKAGFRVTRIPLIPMPAYTSKESREYVAGKGEELNHDVSRRSIFVFENGRLTIRDDNAYAGISRRSLSPDVIVASDKGPALASPGSWQGKKFDMYV